MEEGKKRVKKTKVSLFSEDVHDALIKKAFGYDSTETVEEYSADEGEVKLTKKKITVKNVPPDVTALKILLEKDDVPVETMSDEELEQEKRRLIKMLAEQKEEN